MMVRLENINVNYTILNYGGKTLRHTITTLSTRNLILRKKVLINLSMEVPKGIIYGIIGKNGSGKSTLLRTIAGILPVHSGKSEVKGKSSPIIGVNTFTDGDLTAVENIKFYAALRGFDKNQATKFTSKVLDFCMYTEEELLKPVKTFSHGMTSRLNFALGIFEDCDIYFIDEALSVVDNDFVSRAVEEIKKKKEKGKTIFFVSHNLALVEWVSDKIGIVDNGQILNEGDPSDMTQFYRNIQVN